MAEKVNGHRPCEFFLVRYVPDAVKNEFVNIGVLLREAGGDAQTVVRFTREWGRVRCVDPDADTAMLEALEGEVRLRLGEKSEGVKPLLDVLEDTLSNGVQLTAAKGCLAENLVTEIELLMRLYVEPRKRESITRRSGRQAILAAMRSNFERAGVWDLMRKRIAAAAYTQPGDSLRIDCGYRTNGTAKMFHAVSIEGDVEPAKVLAFSVDALIEGVARVEKAKLELTAIVEPLVRSSQDGEVDKDAHQLAQYTFAKETMEKREIRVLTTSFLSQIAETARTELRV